MTPAPQPEDEPPPAAPAHPPPASLPDQREAEENRQRRNRSEPRRLGALLVRVSQQLRELRRRSPPGGPPLGRPPRPDREERQLRRLMLLDGRQRSRELGRLLASWGREGQRELSPEEKRLKVRLVRRMIQSAKHLWCVRMWHLGLRSPDGERPAEAPREGRQEGAHGPAL